MSNPAPTYKNNTFSKQNTAAPKVETVQTVEAKEVETVPVVETLNANISTIESGAVVSSTLTPVGVSSTKEEIVAVSIQKKETTGGLVLSKESEQLIQRLNLTNNKVAIGAIENIQSYMVQMAPGKTMTPDEGNRHQVSLFRAIRTVIEFTGEDFQVTMVLMLRLFDEFKDSVFHEQYVFRFMDSIPLSQDERRAFERILNLIKISAAVNGRKQALRQVNFQKTLQYVFAEDSKQKLLSFFNI